MTRNRAIKLMVDEIELRSKSNYVNEHASQIYRAAYEDACRNFLRVLASEGAFDDGRNITDRMPPRVNK